MKLQYNIHNFMLQMEKNRWERNPKSLTYIDDDYKNTDLIKWLEENVGELLPKIPGVNTSGIGWTMDMNERTFRSYVEFYIDLDEEKQTEFLLRFS